LEVEGTVLATEISGSFEEVFRMKRLRNLMKVLLFALIFIPLSSFAEEEWSPVFEERNFEGWDSTGQDEWRFIQDILNGLPIQGDTTQLVGPEVPGDFAVRLEFKVLGNREAALHFRSHWLDGVLYGYKVDLLPYRLRIGGASPEGQAGDLYVVGGEEKLVAAASELPVADPGDAFRNWNQLLLRAVGDDISVEINGVEVTRTRDDRFLGGRLAFESRTEGGAGLVMFQNIEFMDLSDESEYTSIFNGENLEGWKIHGLDKQWWVEDGVIHSESVDDAYSYLATDKEYEDFSIIAEFLGLAGGNSGLFFHSHLDGTKISGIQAEVQPPTEERLGHSGNLYDSSGRGWLIDPESLDPEKEAVFRLGEWNTLRVDVKDHHIKTWLNGMRIVDYQDENPTHESGVIALQIHSGGGVKVDWRNLRIKGL